MNLSRQLRFPALATAMVALLVSGCGSNNEDEVGDQKAEGAGQGAEHFYNPREGEVWRYKVQKEIPLELRLSEADAARRPERTESSHLITFERVRTCTGTRQPAGAEKMLTTMEISENGEFLGEELYEISPEAVLSRGWIPASDDEEANVLESGVALATAKMQPGQVWEGVGRDPGRSFLFRVIEVTKVTVPAGIFEAARIQITSEQEGRGLKRTVWFAENVGIVKEEVVYFGPQRVRVREHSELVHWVIPAGDPPPEAAVVSTGDEPSDDPEPAEDEPPVEDGSSEEGEPEPESTEENDEESEDD